MCTWRHHGIRWTHKILPVEKERDGTNKGGREGGKEARRKEKWEGGRERRGKKRGGREGEKVESAMILISVKVNKLHAF